MVKGKSNKGSANKCGFNNVSSSPRRINESPVKKQVKKTPEEEEMDAMTNLGDLKSEIMSTIHAVLDSKLNEMTACLQAAMTSKLAELETKFQKS